jgi:hypothetical protein
MPPRDAHIEDEKALQVASDPDEIAINFMNPIQKCAFEHEKFPRFNTTFYYNDSERFLKTRGSVLYCLGHERILFDEPRRVQSLDGGGR